MQANLIEGNVLALVIGLVAGLLLAYFWSKNRLAQAVQQALAAQSAESLAQEERLRFAAQEQDRLKGERAELQQQNSVLEASLDTVREQRAQLEVHADRVPQLESQLNELGVEHRHLNEQLFGLNQANGEKNNEIANLKSRVMQLSESLQNMEAARDAAQAEARRQGEALAELKSTQDAERQQIAEKQSQIGELQAANTLLQQENTACREKLAELTTTLEVERTQTEEKLALLNEAKESLKTQFENLANQILEEKGQKFTKQNQENLGLLLNPLQEKIKDFQAQVAQTYDKDSKERLTLKNEIERLAALNTKISEDAVNLTQALKGNNKAQGTWGEIVLESVLESSGLRKGQEYIAQASYEKDDGGQHRPDVVVNLPEGKHMVIDAKMSLVAYERYTQAESEADRQAAIKQHLTSVRAHIKGLSEKNYQTLYSLKSLDFVLLFIPVEPAFMLAVTQDSTLFSEAFAKNVLLVSPSTLLATLRTIANIWRQEYQNRNAQEIASQCAKLYDKFVGFVEDLEDVGRKLQATQKAYDSAHGKLKSGRGNLIRQAESFKKLGVKPNKRIPEQLVDLAGDDVGDGDFAEGTQLLEVTA